MKKEWIEPEVKDLNVVDTEAAFCDGDNQDNWLHESKGGPHWHFS